MEKSRPRQSKGTRTVDGTRARELPDDPHRLASAFIRSRQVDHKFAWSLKYWRDEWWVWAGTSYRRLAFSDLQAGLASFIKREFDRLAGRYTTKRRAAAKVTRSLVGNVVQALKGLTLVPAEVEQPSWIDRSCGRRGNLISLANGLVDLDALTAGQEGVLLTHSPAWFSPICLPYSFDSSTKCPRWETFLQEMFEGDVERIALVQEWFGYCLLADTSFQKFLILVGDGANGKTVLLDVLIALLGEQNVSHVPLELFGQRFQVTPTLGKLANIVAEVGPMDRVAEATVKAFVAGDAMYFDRKNQDGLHTRPTARLVLAANTFPAFADRSIGLWRRLIVLPCQTTIPVERQDRQLVTKLKAELPGILMWSVEGRRRLLEQRRFTEPAVSRRVLEEHQSERNSERAFLLKHVTESPGASITSGALYERYKVWCDENGYVAGSDRQFGKEIRRIFSSVTRQRDSGAGGTGRLWRYAGLSLVVLDHEDGL
jgi:P4 family phage/plasmid primase-like protien